MAPGLKIGLGTLGALPVGMLVLAIGLSLGGTTGYAINPARDLGPAHRSRNSSGSGQTRQRLVVRMGAGDRAATGGRAGVLAMAFL